MKSWKRFNHYKSMKKQRIESHMKKFREIDFLFCNFGIFVPQCGKDEVFTIINFTQVLKKIREIDAKLVKNHICIQSTSKTSISKLVIANFCAILRNFYQLMSIVEGLNYLNV